MSLDMDSETNDDHSEIDMGFPDQSQEVTDFRLGSSFFVICSCDQCGKYFAASRSLFYTRRSILASNPSYVL